MSASTKERSSAHLSAGQWVTQFERGVELYQHIDGVPWFRAPEPWRWHKHRAQTRAWTGGPAGYVERCSCGAFGPKPWSFVGRDKPRVRALYGFRRRSRCFSVSWRRRVSAAGKERRDARADRRAFNVFYNAENVFYVEAEDADAAAVVASAEWGDGWAYVEETEPVA